ncbi:MAG: hypothetical protein B7733_22550 [Myxococcales bacterium FL481]|nr:MAG: hypothetical protein B7733_22550 [Myxococcales bacterium FL481]
MPLGTWGRLGVQDIGGFLAVRHNGGSTISAHATLGALLVGATLASTCSAGRLDVGRAGDGVGADTGASAAAATTTDPTGAGEPDPGGEPDESSLVPGGGGDTHPESATGAEPGSATGAEPHSATGTEPEPDSATGTEPEPDAATGDDTGSGTEDDPELPAIDCQAYYAGGAAARTRAAGRGDSHVCPDGVAQGEILIETQAQLDALAGCRVVEGSLKIHGGDVHTLAPLADLECVSNRLYIEGLWGQPPPRLTTLDGLEKLSEVGWGLTISGLPELADVSALGQLHHVDRSVQFRDLDALESLHGLERLRDAGSLIIADLPILRDLKGLSGLTAGPAFRQAAESESESESESEAESESESEADAGTGDANATLHLEIVDCPRITDLRGLESVRGLDYLGLTGAEGLISLAGLSGVESIGHLRLAQLPNLRVVDGLENVQEIGHLNIVQSGVESIGALPSLAEVRALTLYEVPAFRELGPLSSLARLRALTVVKAGPDLSLAKLSSLVFVDRLIVHNNDSLTAEQLPPLHGAGHVVIVVNQKLDQQAAVSWVESLSSTEHTKVDGNMGIPVPYAECPWSSDAECDEITGLCAVDSDADDCLHTPPPD